MTSQLPLVNATYRRNGRVILDGVPPPVFTARFKATWEELHRHALNHDGSDDSYWMEDFSSRVSGIKCDCLSHWLAYLKANPPRWGDYFNWTVEAHNAVNVRLCKKVLTLDQARALWFIVHDA